MISDNVTILIPTEGDCDSTLSLLTELNEQTDITGTRVIVTDHSDSYEKSKVRLLQHKDTFTFVLEVVEGSENVYKSVNGVLDDIETPYFLTLTNGVKFKSNQTIYNCLVELKSSDSKIIIPKLDIQTSGIIETLVKLKFKSSLKSHPFSPLSFFFADTEHVIDVGGFVTYQVEIDEEISICDSFSEDDIYSSNETVVIPNDMQVVNGYLKRIKEIESVKDI